MISDKKKEILLLKQIEDSRRKMNNLSMIHPLHSNEMINISVQLDQLLNEFSYLKKERKQ